MVRSSCVNTLSLAFLPVLAVLFFQDARNLISTTWTLKNMCAESNHNIDINFSVFFRSVLSILFVILKPLTYIIEIFLPQADHSKCIAYDSGLDCYLSCLLSLCYLTTKVEEGGSGMIHILTQVCRVRNWISKLNNSYLVSSSLMLYVPVVT
jgi:hypothetical protein